MEEELKEKTEDGSRKSEEMSVEAPAEAAVKSGRDVFLEKYRGYHPDLEGDPSDDDMWGYAGQGLSERDELKGKYEKLNGSNEVLAGVVSENPRLAQFISMIAAGEHPMYALGKSFGNIIDELDDEGIERLRAGQDEFKARYSRMRDNFSKYESTLKGYAEKNGLTEEQVSDINNAILDIAEALNEGDIPEEVIDNVWKGIDADNEKTAALEAAELAGKNKAISEIKEKKSGAAPLPDLKGAATQPKQPATPKFSDEEYKPYIDNLEVVK